jgi:hypothetical protein
VMASARLADDGSIETLRSAIGDVVIRDSLPPLAGRWA